MKKILLAGVLFLAMLFPLSVYSGEPVVTPLAWNPNSETDLAGYNIYYGRASGDYDFKVTVGMRIDYPVILESGVEYFLALTAFDTSGNESVFSTELAYTVPVPPVVDTDPPVAPTVINIPPDSSVIINIP